MKIETKFDLGQQVFFLNWSQREVIPATIECVKTEVCSDNFNGGEPFTTTIYFLNNGAWVAETTLFLSEEEARGQIANREEWLQRRGM